MAIQIASEAELAKAQQVVIAEVRFTAEHNAPCVNLVEKFTLGQGEKQITVPKVGQMTAVGLTDGVDLVTSADIGMTSVDLTTGEVGLKCILTDKLLRQQKADLYRVVGKQMGEAMARKKDTDVIALFAGLNNGVTLGVATKFLSMANLGGCLAYAKASKYPKPVSIVHHPNTIYNLVKAMTLTPSATYPIPRGYSEDLLKDFWRITIDGVPIFDDGNIAADVDGDAIGVIFSKSALCVVESLTSRNERERDASLRAWELVLVADYGCFELDDSYGAPMTYDAAAIATNA